MMQAAPQKQLRDYQEAALHAIRERFAAGVYRPLLSAATGSGKTEMFSFMIKERIEENQNCLVLAHRDRLVTQAAERIKGIVGWGKVGLVNGDTKDWWHPCVVATIQSAGVEKQLLRAPQFQNIIIDECHRANSPQYRKVIEALLAPGGMLLGVTATPNRTDKKGLIPHVFHELVYEIGMQELIDKGYLAPVIGKEIKLPIDFSKIKTSVSTEGIRDYRPEDVKAAFEEAQWLERITEGWREVASDRRTIIFVPPGIVDDRSCGMAHSLAEFMRLQGIRAAAVDGTTKQSVQDRVIADFTKGDIQVLVNVNIFTEGLDIPPIDCVLFARPTQSSIIYSQSIGRGTRLYPGKKNLLVVDVTGITEQLGKEGQSLMTLGKILPTKEQILNEKAERIKAAKLLIRKLWRKHVTLRLVGEKLHILGQIGVKDKKKLDELMEEVVEVLSVRDKTSQDDEPAETERRPVNTSLLSADRFEIREIDFTRATMRFKWDIDPADRKATLQHDGVEYLIARPHPEGDYTFAEMSIGGFEGRAATYTEAKNAIERHLAKDEMKKQAIFKNPNAPWRQKPMSDKQKTNLERMRIPYPPGCTMGQASDLLAVAFSRKSRRQA